MWQVLVWVFLVCRPAWAASPLNVAVLPLNEGATSEAYEGLGIALSGMLMTDLGTVETLQIVERQRLDDLLAEIELGQSGFVDPSTAARLGKGVGAEAVVVGSYSVLRDTFLLDARIVEVASGKMLHSASSRGAVDDFVSVEKELVEGLLTGLDRKLSGAARRKVLGQAPTESFEAMAAFGQGLARRSEGDVQAAREAFDKALKRDPAFADARVAQQQLEASIAATVSSQADAFTAAIRGVQQRVLEAVPASRPAGFVYDDAAKIDLVLRWWALDHQRRYCELAQEQKAYLDRIDWEVTRPGKSAPYRYGNDLERPLKERAEALGFTEGLWDEYKDRDEVPPLGNVTDWVSSTHLLLIGDHWLEQRLQGYVGSTVRCRGSERALATYDAVKREIANHGQLGEHRQYDYDWNVGQTIDFFWMIEHAKTRGSTSELQARLDRWLAQEVAGDKRDDLVKDAERVRDMANRYDDRRRRRLGYASDRLTEVLESVARAVAGQTSRSFEAASPFCAAVVAGQPGRLAQQAHAMWTAAQATPDQRDDESALDRAAMPVAVALDGGCIKGTAARYASTEALLEALTAVPLAPGAEPYCAALQLNIQQQSSPGVWQTLANGRPEYVHQHAGNVLVMYYQAVANGCVEMPRPR